MMKNTLQIKAFGVLVFCLLSQLAFPQKYKYDIFSSVDFNVENFDFVPGTMRQNFTTIIIDYGSDIITLMGNVFVVQEKNQKVSGSAVIKTFVCINSNQQKCVINYVYDYTKDWDTRNLFYVIFANMQYGMLLSSNDPSRID